MVNLLREGEDFYGYQQAVWEDDTHVLVTTYSSGDWAVVRIGIDGSQEYALPPVAGGDMDSPFLLGG